MSSVVIAGNTSGSITISAPDVSGSNTLTLPVATDTLVGKATTDTLTNKTLVNPTITDLQSLNAPNTFGFKNRIINGGMVIDQRNAGASVTVNSGTDAFAVDRFPAAASGGGVFTMQRSTTSATNFSNSLLATVTTADSSIAAGDYYGIQHKIEGFNTADFNSGTANAKTITLSFWVRSSIIGTYGLGLGNNANNRWYPASYAISSANTWEQKSITLTCDTSGTWDATTGTGLWLWFDLGSGSTYQGTANAWTSSTKFTVAGATQWIATNSATFYITGVQLEKGSTATSFDFRDYGRELAMCQRYYYKLSETSNAAVGMCNAATSARLNVPFPLPMRLSPAALEQSGTAADYNVNTGSSAITCSSVPTFLDTTTNNGAVTFTVASGLTLGNGALGRGAGYLAWSAEL